MPWIFSRIESKIGLDSAKGVVCENGLTSSKLRARPTTAKSITLPMGDLGHVIESGIGARPEEMRKLDALGGLAGWKEAVTKISEAHAVAFKQTPFIFTAAKSIGGQNGWAPQFA